MRVLVSGLMMLRDLERFRPRLEAAGLALVAAAPEQFLREDELLPIIGGFDGVIAGDDQFTARVLEAAVPRLKIISKWGVGLDSIDLDAARRLGIRVTNTAGAFADAVGEVALGYMLMLGRRLGEIDRAVRAGGWPKPECEGLAGQHVGLVGFGAIGRAIARRASALGMVCTAYDPRMAEMEPGEGAGFAPLDAVVAQSRYLCLCCNLTPENRHMISGPRLEAMPAGAFLINVARGPLVDEAALIAALGRGAIAGAALDVFENEPLAQDSPLKAMENVVLGSHNANNLASANQRVHENTIANLLAGLGLAAASA